MKKCYADDPRSVLRRSLKAVEHWRPVANNPNYIVSSHGRIARLKRAYDHVDDHRNNGYSSVALYEDGKRMNDELSCSVYIALVALAGANLVCRHE